MSTTRTRKTRYPPIIGWTACPQRHFLLNKGRTMLRWTFPLFSGWSHHATPQFSVNTTSTQQTPLPPPLFPEFVTTQAVSHIAFTVSLRRTGIAFQKTFLALCFVVIIPWCSLCSPKAIRNVAPSSDPFQLQPNCKYR